MNDVSAARLLLVNALGLLVYMTVGWVVAKQRNRIDTVDTLWGMGFVLAAYLVLAQHFTLRSFELAILIAVWGVRLSVHLAQRSASRGEDPRYVEIKSKWKGDVWTRAYFSIFLLQGFLIWIVSSVTVFAAGKEFPHGTGYTVLQVVGILTWIFGIYFESTADKQLKEFVSNKKNKGKVLDTGLWRYSRHPNYFGELAQWWGLGIIACEVSYGWLGLIGPLVLTILIVFVSGIPPAEKHRKKDPKYQDYMRRTSVLIPLAPRRQP
jgi:steroid 5-alpha reductase family enzyme